VTCTFTTVASDGSGVGAAVGAKVVMTGACTAASGKVLARFCVTAARLLGLDSVLVSAAAVSDVDVEVTRYLTLTPASSLRRAVGVTLSMYTLQLDGRTASNEAMKDAWNSGESVTPEMVCTACTATAAAGVGAPVVGSGVGGDVVGSYVGYPVDGNGVVGSTVGVRLMDGAAVVGSYDGYAVVGTAVGFGVGS